MTNKQQGTINLSRDFATHDFTSHNNCVQMSIDMLFRFSLIFIIIRMLWFNRYFIS